MRTAAILMISALLSACNSAGDRHEANRKVVTRTYALAGFENVALKGSDDVRVIPGSAFAISATGAQAEIDALDIKTDNGTLVIARKNRDSGDWHLSFGNRHDKGVVVTVTMPLIRSASLAGSGDLSVDTTAEDKFEGSLGGSGDLVVTNFRAAKGVFSVAGSGDLKVIGTAKDATISLAGSGDIDASGLASETLNVSLTGSGDVSAKASGRAEVSLVGSGDVRISGTKDCKISKMGSGEVTCG